MQRLPGYLDADGNRNALSALDLPLVSPTTTLAARSGSDGKVRAKLEGASAMDLEPDFRSATEDDFVQLAALRCDARAAGQGERSLVGRAEFAQACTPFLRQGLAQGGRMSFVAGQASHLVARLTIQRIPLFPRRVKIGDYMGLITENYTRPVYRNGGIGSRLLRLERLGPPARVQAPDCLPQRPSRALLSARRLQGPTGGPGTKTPRLLFSAPGRAAVSPFE